MIVSKNLHVVLTLFAVEVFLEGGAVTDIRPEVRTGDLLSSFAIKNRIIMSVLRRKKPYVNNFLPIFVILYTDCI